VKLVYIKDKLVVIFYYFALILYAIIDPFLLIRRRNLLFHVCLLKAPRAFSMSFKHYLELAWFDSNIKVFNLSLEKLIAD
jgi:hypothetical protein